MTVIRSQLIGTGYKLPAKILTNDDLSKMVETNDEWISTRTGIRSRHIAAEGETTCDLSYDAALTAIENAGIKNSEIDFVIVATVTPDNTFPATAAKLAKRLELNPGTPAMDVNAACSGFVYASQIADNMIRLGQVKTALVIGAETLSKIYADGSQYDHLCSDGGVSLNQKAGFIHMDGKEVFKVAIPSLVQGVEESLKIAGININEVNWYVPHQANLRIIDSVAKKLEIDMDKVVVTVDHHGNTSAASIPLALAESFAAGKFKKGDVIAISAMGAGFTWGGMVIRI